jgi:hypothetical protein
VIRRATAPDIPEAMRLYLTLGDYASGTADLQAFALAGQVMRGRLAGLRAAWALYGPVIMRTLPARAPLPFAVEVLENVAEGDRRGVLEILRRHRGTA